MTTCHIRTWGVQNDEEGTTSMMVSTWCVICECWWLDGVELSVMMWSSSVVESQCHTSQTCSVHERQSCVYERKRDDGSGE